MARAIGYPGAVRSAVLLVAVAGCGFSLSAGGGTDGSTDGPGDGTLDDASPDVMIDVPIDAPIDAPMLDAFVFTPALCPPGYDQTTAASAGSRYRVITGTASFATQHADCNNDSVGWTHLAAYDTQAEATAVGAMVSTGFFYVGVVQAPNQTAVAAGWRLFTGPALTTAWSQGGSFAQPEDDEDYVEDGEESLVVSNTSGQLYDVSGTSAYRAVCECDGKPIDPAVAAMIP